MKHKYNNRSLASKVYFSINAEEDVVDKINIFAWETNQSRSSVINEILSVMTRADREELHAMQDYILKILQHAKGNQNV